MEWRLAHPLDDVDDIVELAFASYEHETVGVLSPDRNVLKRHVTITATVQLFDKDREFLAVCREFAPPEYGQGELLAYCWFDRGGYTTYSNEEITNSKFHFVDLSLPTKTRVRLLNQMIDQHILWASIWNIPVICSTSIRAEHNGFMKIHKKRGFTVNGSYAWIRTENGLKDMK
jgi:hypothetical protein